MNIMDISAIIKSLVSAKKIGAMTLAAIALTYLAYLFDKKTGIIESENKVGTLFILFLIAFLFVVALGFLYMITTSKMRYEHVERMSDKEIKKTKEFSEKPISQTIVNQREKGTFIDKNDGNIQINIQ